MAASLIDLSPPYDPTAYAGLTGAQILQLVSGLTPYIDKGLVLSTTDIAGNPVVPDAVTNTKWQGYMWRRQTATVVNCYVWNVNGATDPTYQNWVSVNIAGIGIGSIVGAMIAANTITDDNISNVGWSKLIGTPPAIPVTGAAGGDLAGTYPNPTVANLAITGAKIALATILGTNVAANTLLATNIVPSTAFWMLRTNAGATAVEWFSPPLIFTTAGIPVLANANKLLAVNGTGTDYTVVTPASIAQSNTFTSGLAAIGVGKIIDTPHGLGVTPSSVRGRMVCQTGELGYTVGDEVSLQSVFLSVGPLVIPPVIGVSATNVFVVFYNSVADILIAHKTTGVVTQITNGNWQVKVTCSV